MEVFKEYLDAITDPEMKERTGRVLSWTHETFPELGRRIAWSNPHFIHQDTFIIAFSLAKDHLAVAPETKALKHFADDIKQAGLKASKMLLKLPWDKPVDYALLEKIIRYNMADKKGLTTYWRPKEDW